jgi:hypothetical protein
MRIIKKPYKLTPLNREIEKINRIIWLADNKDDIFPIYGFSNLSELRAYFIGLKRARELVKTKIDYKKEI